MYGYEEYIDLSPEQVLQRISQEQVFEFILQEKIDIESRYCSPFREDTHPGCRFDKRPDGTILFIDFGERFINPDKIHRSCFGMVMDMYQVTMSGAIRIICDRFGLSKMSSELAAVERYDYEKQPKQPTIIKYDPKPMAKYDILEWSQYLIKPEHLKEDNVFPVKRFSIKNHRGYRIFTPYQFCYAIDFLERVKLYQPYSEKYKWLTNCTEDDIGNIDNLPRNGDELIIKKSYKDHRVLRNLELSLNVIWFQNEGCVPSLEILKMLTDRFTTITVFFDNDFDGVLASLKLVAILNNIKPGCARMVHLPIFREKRDQQLKDPAAFIKKEGKRDLIQVLNYIGIYGKVA